MATPQNLDDYPVRLFVKHMAEIFGISQKRAYALHAEGAFLFCENRPRVGRISFSRERVRQYLAGEIRGLTDRSRRLIA